MRHDKTFTGDDIRETMINSRKALVFQEHHHCLNGILLEASCCVNESATILKLLFASKSIEFTS